MTCMETVCPCCGKTIQVRVSDGTVTGAVFDAYTDDLKAKLTQRGLEFGVTEGGETKDGE